MSNLIKIFILIASHMAFGAIHYPTQKIEKSPLFFENAQQLVTKPQNQQEAQSGQSNGFYNAYFGNLDGKISLLYREQWGFHDQNLPFRSSSWRGEFISNSAASGTIVYDWQERESFAKQVFRMRIEQGLREGLNSLKRSEVVAKAQGTLDSLRDVSITTAQQSDGSKAQLKLGYDLLSDSSKLEYVGGSVDVGIYKNRMLSNPTDQSSALMTMSTGLGPLLGRASISMPLSAQQIQTTVSKQLSSTVATSVSSTQPLKAQQNSSYYWNVAFSF